MKKTLILSLAATAISVSSLNVLAGNDDKYPAYDFQPKVIYADKDLISSFGEADSNASGDNSRKAPQKVAEFDPKYPAANFQPKVIYP